MNYMTISEVSKKWKITPKRIQVLCSEGRVEGAVRFGTRAWAIPIGTEKPKDGRIKKDVIRAEQTAEEIQEISSESEIMNEREEQEKLRLTIERHKVIMDQTTDIIFEWDILKDTLDFSANWEKKYGYQAIFQNISSEIPLSHNIHPEDMPSFIKIMQDTAAGVPYSETEFRIRNITGIYRWSRIRATAQFNSENQPIKAVGVIVDIDEEKSKYKLLLELAQRDSLTKLYNKTTTKRKVEKLLGENNGGELHALMIVDVDNFKTVNDRFGHQCGDAVLLNMAQTLKKIFCSNDIIGRIGGDEFLVFMKGMESINFASEKAAEIVNIFNTIEMPLEISEGLSCSVGIAVYPKDALNYTSIFQCADSALYQAKNNGKKNFSFYEASKDKIAPLVLPRTAINETIDTNTALDEDFMNYAFQILYRAADIKVALKEVLKMVGTAYDVSRAYIFEVSEDESYCSNTFEWCSEGIAPAMDYLQNLSFKTDLAGFFDLYDENGVFYCQDVKLLNAQLCSVLEAQGIVSVLQCFIKDEGCMRGYIGFDECKGKRYWTKEQIHILTRISNIISVFLVKLRLKEKLEQQKNSVEIE